MTCPPLVWEALWDALIRPNVSIPYQFHTSGGITQLIASYASPIIPKKPSAVQHKIPPGRIGDTLFFEDKDGELLMTRVVETPAQYTAEVWSATNGYCRPVINLDAKTHPTCYLHTYHPEHGISPCLSYSTLNQYQSFVPVLHPVLNISYIIYRDRIHSSTNQDYKITTESVSSPSNNIGVMSTQYLAVTTGSKDNHIDILSVDKDGVLATKCHYRITHFADRNDVISSIYVHGSHLYVLIGVSVSHSLTVIDLETKQLIVGMLMNVDPRRHSLGVCARGIVVLDHGPRAPVLKWYV